jgi:hypothetical protein
MNDTIALYLSRTSRGGAASRPPSDTKLAAIAHVHSAEGPAWTRDPGVFPPSAAIRRDVGVAPEQSRLCSWRSSRPLVGALSPTLRARARGA